MCPSVKGRLFCQSPGGGDDDDDISIAGMFRNNQLTYSIREPALNVYTAPHGCFAKHKDHQALSVLIPLSDPRTEFEGGGTAFWSQSAPLEGLDPPALVLKPPPGTALLWGGRVSHQGQMLTEGSRVVLVASVSGPSGPPGDLQERFSGGGLGLKTVLSGR